MIKIYFNGYFNFIKLFNSVKVDFHYCSHFIIIRVSWN